MDLHNLAPWHKASFERLLNERLPELLAARLPLAGYHADMNDAHTRRLQVTLTTGAGDITLDYRIPQPSHDGVFTLDQKPYTVVPLASTEELDIADIRCVGEQLYDFLASRLGEAPADLPWDDAIARAWLPLESWVGEFMRDTAQRLDTTNWLARHTHLRRVVIPEISQVITPGQLGRVCPFETPEGPNIGRVFSVALGAEIRDRRLVIVDDAPEAALGLTASMMPFLEHNDANRLLIGVNMLRQALIPPDPEPAIVQTGNEPATPDFWYGRNLLTAFTSLGGDTYEDSAVISASCARRLSYPTPVEPGDKLSNRHGTKCVVSRILPDDEMPHLPDGTPVDIVYSFIALHARMNFGQLREALLSRIARAEGQPAIVPPFRTPNEEAFRARLAAAGLPASGMKQLTLGVNGPALAQPTTVGWVYWCRLVHMAREKMHVCVEPAGRCQQLAELEYRALRDAGAVEVIREEYNTCAAERPDAGTLALRVMVGEVAPAPPPTPQFAELTRRLAVAGIQSELTHEQLTFRFTTPADGVTLAHPLPHPWLQERELTAVGGFPELPEYAALVKANTRLARLQASQAPESLQHKAVNELAAQVRAFFAALLTPTQLQFTAQVLFSGRTVAVPAPELRMDQVGLAEELAWTLYGPLVARELGSEEEVTARSERAAAALDARMARSWLIVYRLPAVMPSTFLAFHPVRYPDRAIHLHPGACMLMNADFDGDQLAVFLPLTAEAQRDTAAHLSIAGHLRRDPALLKWVSPRQEALWGLARLGLTQEGRQEVEGIIGAGVSLPPGLLTSAGLADAMQCVMARDGIDGVLAVIERLMQRGLAVAKHSGASMSPFLGATLQCPPLPESDDFAPWQAYVEEISEIIASRTDYLDADLGPQLLAVKSGSRGQVRHMERLLGPFGPVAGFAGQLSIIRHGFVDGLTPQELFTSVVGARKGLQQTVIETMQFGYGVRPATPPSGFTPLVRAMQAQHPGIVFARAAASGEVDPLVDMTSRLFVGLPAAL